MNSLVDHAGAGPGYSHSGDAARQPSLDACSALAAVKSLAFWETVAVRDSSSAGQICRVVESAKRRAAQTSNARWSAAGRVDNQAEARAKEKKKSDEEIEDEGCASCAEPELRWSNHQGRSPAGSPERASSAWANCIIRLARPRDLELLVQYGVGWVGWVPFPLGCFGW